jgi:ribosome biogenesis GTPase A
MHKANKELAKLIQQTDVVIEVLDARMPAASANPLLHKTRLRHHKPCVHILNKADLADPTRTKAWIQHFNRQPGSAGLANGKDNLLSTNLILGLCQRLVDEQALMPKRKTAQPSVDAQDAIPDTDAQVAADQQDVAMPAQDPCDLLEPSDLRENRNDNPNDSNAPGRVRKFTAIIVGIPNVGKSTLMNQIAGRKLAKTGNEPAITKSQQRIRLNEQWYLFDTPGVLWPRLEDQAAAYRLAAAGAIRNTAIVFEDVAMEAAEFLLRDFPETLKHRYGLSVLPDTAEDFMSELATRRACRTKSGNVDWHRVSEILLHDFREGRLGRLTLETPPVPAEPPETQKPETGH